MSQERLRLETDPKNEVQRIYLDPKCFSLTALRRIARGQVSNSTPREITIITNQISGSNYRQSVGCHFPYSRLQDIRKMHKKEKRIAIKDLAQKMYDADDIIIASALSPS